MGSDIFTAPSPRWQRAVSVDEHQYPLLRRRDGRYPRSSTAAAAAGAQCAGRGDERVSEGDEESLREDDGCCMFYSRRIGLESSDEAGGDGKAYDSAEDVRDFDPSRRLVSRSLQQLLRLEAIGTGRVQCKVKG